MYFSDRSASRNCAKKSESKNPGNKRIFEDADSKNNFEVEKVGHKNAMILNHADLNHINNDSNNSDQVDSNYADVKELIPTDSKTTNDSYDIHALNQLLLWYGESTKAAASTISMRTPLDYVSSINTSHITSLLH